MKNLKLLIFVIILCSCETNLVGDGAVIEKEIILENTIQKIDASGNFNIVLIQDNSHKVVIEAQQNLMDNLKLEEDEERLTIFENSSVSTDEIYKIYLYSNNLEKLDIKGNVVFDVSGEIRKEEFQANLSENSKMLAQLFIENLELNASDNSQLTLKGSCSDFEAKFEDNSQMLAPDFIVNAADIDLKNNAQVNLQVMKTLEGASADNSILEYRGNPDKNFQAKDQSKLLKTE